MEDDNCRILERDNTQTKLRTVGIYIIIERFRYLVAIYQLREVIGISHNRRPAIAGRTGYARCRGMVFLSQGAIIHMIETHCRAIWGEDGWYMVLKFATILNGRTAV